MVGSTEGSLTDERVLLLQFACNGVYLCGFKTFAEGEGRKDGGETFCHHGLATTRTADKNDVVSSCCCHLKGTFDVLLTFHLVKIVGEGEELGVKFFTSIYNGGQDGCGAAEKANDFVQMLHAIDFQVIHHCGFTCILFRHEQGFVPQFPCLDGDGQHSLDR